MYEFFDLVAFLRSYSLINRWNSHKKIVEKYSFTSYHYHVSEVSIMLDWISIVFWVVIVLRIVMGIWKGGFKTLATLIIIAVAFGAAFLLCRPIGEWIGSLGARQAIQDAANGRLQTIIFASGEGYELGLGTQVSMGDLNSMHDVWVSAGNTGTTEDMLKSILHEGYSSCLIPSAIHGNLDKLILEAIPATGTFTMASVIATALATAACIGIGFGATFLVILIVGLVIKLIVNTARSAAGQRPGVISRIVGAALGVVSAFLFCWSAAIILRMLASGVPAINDFVTTSMKLNDPSYWNIGKFFFTFPYGYTDLLNWVLSLIHLQ